MAIVISDSLVLSRDAIVNPNVGLLCWNSIVTPTNITSNNQTEAEPIENAANVSTSFVWSAEDTSESIIDIDVSNQLIDFVGIARHNLSPGASFELQFVVDNEEFTIIEPDTISFTKQAVLITFTQARPDTVRIRIKDNVVPPRIAVIYVGLATRIQRPIYVGHTPITMGNQLTTLGSISESGQYLGEIIRREKFTTNVSLQNLTPNYLREQLLPFFQQRPRRPAFWAWRPVKFEAEVGYSWLVGNPRPVNQRSNGMMQVSFDLDAIV
jgi:hypothetical protein